MARFSVGRDDEDFDEGHNNNTIRRSSKKLRITPPSTATTTHNHYCDGDHHHGDVENVGQIVKDEEEEEGKEDEFDSEESEEEDHEIFNKGQETWNGGDWAGKGGADCAGPAGRAMSVILSDPDVLDCPICFDPLTIPVFQCENGHVACASCCIKIANKCPSCSWPIGYNRCRAIANVLDSVKILCRYGCKETLPYSKRYEHEKSCVCAPCSCPFNNCNFVGSSKHLYAHFGRRHLNSAKSFRFNSQFPIHLEKNQRSLILRERTEGIIFIINHANERAGSAVNVVCIGPIPSGKGFQYDIICRDGDSSLKLQSFAESTRQWSFHHPIKKYLLVPNDFIGSCGQLKLEVCIRSFLGVAHLSKGTNSSSS